MEQIKWKTIVALIVIYLAIVFGWTWVWGVLFLMWTYSALLTGHTHLVEDISKDENPVLFLLIVMTWIGLSLLLIIDYFYPLGA